MPIGFLLGVGATVATAAAGAAAFRRRQREHLEPVARDPACATAIVLFAPDGSVGSRAIDATTGRLGFSHVALQGCEVDADGRPLVLDCQVGEGVTRRALSAYDGRARSTVYLPGPAAAEAYGCMRARVGLDFNPGRRDGWTCGQIITDCLPGELRGLILGARRYAGPGGLVSPNQIGAAFGARPGQDVVIW